MFHTIIKAHAKAEVERKLAKVGEAISSIGMSVESRVKDPIEIGDDLKEFYRQTSTIASAKPYLDAVKAAIVTGDLATIRGVIRPIKIVVDAQQNVTMTQEEEEEEEEQQQDAPVFLSSEEEDN